jgi:two-component system chemotaxis sensor kinase CheA
VRAARDDGSTDTVRRDALPMELRALNPDAASEEFERSHQESLDDDQDGAGFEPVPICFDDLENDVGNEPVPAENLFNIRFTPKPDLYAKANETALLIRELGHLGEMEVICDSSRLPMLDELDPGGSYLSWTIMLRTTRDESSIGDVFEFVEWDCELDVAPGGAAPEQSDEALDYLIKKSKPASRPSSPRHGRPQPLRNPRWPGRRAALRRLQAIPQRASPTSHRRPRFVSISIASTV